MSNSVAREKAVFCEAVEITDLEQRRQFLDQACGADKALRVRVAAIFKNFAAGLTYWSRKETNDYSGLMLLSLHSYRHGDYASAMDLARQGL